MQLAYYNKKNDKQLNSKIEMIFVTSQSKVCHIINNFEFCEKIKVGISFQVWVTETEIARMRQIHIYIST